MLLYVIFDLSLILNESIRELKHSFIDQTERNVVRLNLLFLCLQPYIYSVWSYFSCNNG